MHLHSHNASQTHVWNSKHMHTTKQNNIVEMWKHLFLRNYRSAFTYAGIQLFLISFNDEYFIFLLNEWGLILIIFNLDRFCYIVAFHPKIQR